MKKNNTREESKPRVTKCSRRELQQQAGQEQLTIGLDMGDRMSQYCVLSKQGEKLREDRLGTTRTGLSSLFEKLPRVRVVLEAGTHSPWASRHLTQLGHEVIVANPRRVQLISGSRRKNDRVDAEKLARLGRMDPELLSPIRHRGEETQRDLAEIRTRNVLVEARTKLINAARGQIKSLGYRLDSCDCDQADADLAQGLPEEVREVVKPLLETVAHLSGKIALADQRIQEVAKRYPEITLLTAIGGVGELTALTFVLTIENAERFGKSRQVGPYLGLVPGQAQSGNSDPQQRITKEGDRMMRWLLVQCAHCMMRHGAADSDLRRWGLAKLEEMNARQQSTGGKHRHRGKKRVLVAVARRLAVLMHKLWASGEVYDPLYRAKRLAKKAQPVAAA